MKKIILAGGCFWGVEAYFSKLKGVLKTKVGYIDGKTTNPNYQDVCSFSNHAEACYIEYDEKIISLNKILEHFFRIINPYTINRQANDIGIQYRSGIYYFDDDYQEIKNFLDDKQKRSDKKIYTYLKEAMPFYDAEEYHQKYLDKNPSGYCHINMNLLKKDEIK